MPASALNTIICAIGHSPANPPPRINYAPRPSHRPDLTPTYRGNQSNRGRGGYKGKGRGRKSDNRRGRRGRNDECWTVPIESVTIVPDTINAPQVLINIVPAAAPAQSEINDLSFPNEYTGTDLSKTGEDVTMIGGPLAEGDFNV